MNMHENVLQDKILLFVAYKHVCFNFFITLHIGGNEMNPVRCRQLQAELGLGTAWWDAAQRKLAAGSGMED